MQKKQRIPKNTKVQRTKKAKGASAYDEALYFLTPKARTVREVENRLDECNYSEGEIMAAIDRLRNNGLLNEEKFARDFIESRLNTKPVSRGKLPDREYFVTSFRQGGYPPAPLMRLLPVDLPSVDGFENRPTPASFEKLLWREL